MMTGKQLRDLREEAGLTQAELADRLDTSQSVISMYENGVRAISRNNEFVFKRELVPDFLEKQQARYQRAIESAFATERCVRLRQKHIDPRST